MKPLPNCHWCDYPFSFHEAIERSESEKACPKCKRPVIYVQDEKTLRYSWQKLREAGGV